MGKICPNLARRCSQTLQNSSWDGTLPPVNIPDYCRRGNAGQVLPSLRSSLCSLETRALGVEMVAVGFAFGGTGVQKMGMECLQETELLEVASSGEHKCYLTRT